MNAWPVIETLLLALVFFASLLVAWRAVHPDSLRRARTDLALALLAPSRPRWVRRLGRLVALRYRRAGGHVAAVSACRDCATRCDGESRVDNGHRDAG
jgi:hypothetical protein